MADFQGKAGKATSQLRQYRFGSHGLMPMSVEINPVTRPSRDAKKKGAREDLSHLS